MNSENLPVVSANNGAALHVAPDTSPRSDFEEQPVHSGIGLSDILFVLFRHKWKIIFCGLVGLVSAAAVYFLFPPVYESQAKLLVRYVMERSAVDGLDNQIKTPTPENDTLLNSEIQILTSSDLLRQVAESVGTNKLGLGPDASMQDAVELLGRSLDVSVVKESNIISVVFASSNPSLPMPVVQELVKRYFDKHLEVHRSLGAFNFVAQETAELKKRLAETGAELKELKDSVGIISLTEAKANLAAEFGQTQQELDSAISDFAAQQARVKDLEKSLAVSATQGAETRVQPVSGDVLEQYKSLMARLTQLQKAESDLLLKYTSESPIVKVKAAQIAELEKQRGALEKQYPTVIGTATAQGGQEAQPNLASERAILAGFESKLAALKARMSDLQARAKTISQVAPRIEELERKAEVEETNYKHSEASLERARIDETLDPSRMPNISAVQTPSPAIRAKRNVQKIVVGMAGGGFAVGIAIALLIELILDRSVKRSFELETRLQIPLLLTIPYVSPSRAQLRLRDTREDGELIRDGNRQEISIADRRGELLQPFCEAIRDRLGVFFDINNMAYKPKLVAVTGLGENAGTSTLAAGLAAAFSETSEGKVRLIDRPVSTKGFYNMLAEFKRSDLEYVIFDLPCLGDTSATLPLARFMDTVLLVVEAEKSSRNAVKRAYAQLAAKTNVSVVFNKSRSYGRWLEGDI
jgi:uncharacterized protein involved in exopolysaccharide biosynthesis